VLIAEEREEEWAEFELREWELLLSDFVAILRLSSPEEFREALELLMVLEESIL